MWFIGVEVEQETSAPPPKKKSWIRPCGRLYSKTFQLPLQCRTLVLMRKVSVTLSFFRGYFNNHKKPQVSIQRVRDEKNSTSGPLGLNQKEIF